MTDTHQRWIRQLAGELPTGVPPRSYSAADGAWPVTFGRYDDEGRPLHVEDGTETHCFQCIFCRHYVPLEGSLGADWGACNNPSSEYDQRCVFEHWTCKAFQEAGMDQVENPHHHGGPGT